LIETPQEITPQADKTLSTPFDLPARPEITDEVRKKVQGTPYKAILSRDSYWRSNE
jgi:hypothetical protein